MSRDTGTGCTRLGFIHTETMHDNNMCSILLHLDSCLASLDAHNFFQFPITGLLGRLQDALDASSWQVYNEPEDKNIT